MLHAEAAVGALISDRPRLTSFFSDLNAASIPWGIFSGGAVSLLTGGRPMADLDILIDGGRFGDVSGLLPGARLEYGKSVAIKADDGARLVYGADEIIDVVDGVEVQIMRERTPVRCAGHEYQINMTPLAAAARLEFRLGGTAVFLANPFDTVAAKAIFQRGPDQGKHDLADALALAPLVPLVQNGSDYVWNRATEIGLDGRAYRVIEWAGAMALQPQLAAKSEFELAGLLARA